MTIEALLAANPKIKNPNKIAVGDEITIPVPEQRRSGGGDGGASGGSPAPERSRRVSARTASG